MGVSYCCASTDVQNRHESVQLYQQMGHLTPQDGAGLPNMKKMVSDASRRVRELKRTVRTEDYENDNPLKNDNTPERAGEDYQSNKFDLSSMGEAMDFSPKPASKKKKKGFVRLSSYENQGFTSTLNGGGGQLPYSPASQSKSQNQLETPGKMQKSVSSRVFNTASPLEKQGLARCNSIGGKMKKQNSASSRDLYGKKSLKPPRIDQVSFGRQNSQRGDSDQGSSRHPTYSRQESLTESKKLRSNRLMRGLTQFTNEQVDQQGTLRSKQFR